MNLTGEAKSYSIRAEKHTDQMGIGLLTTVVLSNLITTDELIILTCEECSLGQGWIKVYDRESLELLH